METVHQQIMYLIGRGIINTSCVGNSFDGSFEYINCILHLEIMGLIKQVLHLSAGFVHYKHSDKDLTSPFGCTGQLKDVSKNAFFYNKTPVDHFSSRKGKSKLNH